MLKGASAAAVLLATSGIHGSPARGAYAGAASRASVPALGGSTLLGYAFGLQHQDVTIFDVATRRVVATRPLGVPIRWLANAQRFWDGQLIWTYTFGEIGSPVQVIGIDPVAVEVARSIPTSGAGPAHSVMLTPDLRRAWVNIAGENTLDEVDLAAGEVVASVPTGEFP